MVEADGFKCVCTQHFLGDRCEAVRRYCLYDNPCDNNAVCEDIHDGRLIIVSDDLKLMHVPNFEYGTIHKKLKDFIIKLQKLRY
jgi:hypothetical protein